MPAFGKRAKRAVPARREPFEFTFLRDEKPETHHFQARARADMVSLANTLHLAKSSPEAAMPEMLRLVSRLLDNKDGTPLNWAPVALSVAEPEPGEQERADMPQVLTPTSPGQWAPTEYGGTLAVEPEEDDDPPPRVFRGPDGELYEFEHAQKFTAFEAGSSRRRWHQLMELDDDIEVDAQDLMELFEWLVGLAAGRPTRPSS